MKKIIIYLLSTLLGLFLGGCCFGNPTPIVSPGRVGPDHLSGEIVKLKSFCKKLPDGKCDKNRLEIIGHGAGSFRHYPIDITKKGKIVGNDGAKVHSFAELMKSAFDDRDLTAIEIDAQLPPHINHKLHTDNNPNTSFVMHNTPNWNKLTQKDQPDAFNYLQKNTLPIVLKEFISKGYHQKGKKLYLELKATNECAHPGDTRHQCTDAPSRVARDIQTILKLPDANSHQWLTVISFSASVLETLREKLGEQYQNKIGYALVAGYDKDGLFSMKAKLAQCKGDVPKFDHTMKTFVATRAWISNIWFSTKGISNPAKEFESLVQMRQKIHPDIPLKFIVASYDRNWNGFEKSIREFPYPLVSIMIDIDDEM